MSNIWNYALPSTSNPNLRYGSMAATGATSGSWYWFLLILAGILILIGLGLVVYWFVNQSSIPRTSAVSPPPVMVTEIKNRNGGPLG